MIAQTEAIVLAIHPWSRTSHMVTWLSRDFGRIVTPVKGACRPKSAFLGQYDLFYTCRLDFYRKEHDGIHAIRECAPLRLREPLRGRWRAAAAAGYLCDLTARVSATPQDAAALFDLLTLTLDRLSAEPRSDLRALILWYEIHLLRHLGLSPDLTLCPLCHTPETPWYRFSLASGRFLCPHLAQLREGERAVALHREVRKLAIRMVNCPSAPVPDPLPVTFAEKNFEENANPILGLARFLGMFIQFHLDAPSAVRRVAWEMIAKNPT
ncbi:MAG: DNA repair protein RecO [Kiritimatiellae bacterium]|nr:DNA repair protein RecO [Kiritimatiellia bacterium]